MEGGKEGGREGGRRRDSRGRDSRGRVDVRMMRINADVRAIGG